MENLFLSMDAMRATGMLLGRMPGDAHMPWIATRDIGAYAATRLAARDFSGSSTRELHGQRDISMNEAASIVGQAIENPHLAYAEIPGPALEEALLDMGMPRKSAELIVEMWDGANAGLISPLEPRSATTTTPTSLETFVNEVFAPAYSRAV
jgi:uncharacterized protein YbjT (DUF2867 family)